MSRELPTNLQTDLGNDVVYPFFAIEMFFDSGAIRTWTGVGDIEYDSNTYTGSGSLLAVSTVEETNEISVRGVTLSLSGIPSELLSLALSTPYQGRVCNVYLGLLHKDPLYTANDIEPQLVADFMADYYALAISDPYNLTPIFSGYMDKMDISESAETCSIEMAVENKLIDLERARVARFTSGYQKSIYPNDLGLDFVESLQDRPISWGKVTK